MKKIDIVQTILPRNDYTPQQKIAQQYAPTNIALVKYWGKRDLELNLPVTSSISLSLDKLGATTSIAVIESKDDEIILNKKLQDNNSNFSRRIVEYLNLFRFNNNYRYRINTEVNIPVASGVASSACGFAALILALNSLFNWQLSKQQLSILARIGSGSAARSLWEGFVIWHAGSQANGMDSFAEPLNYQWPELKCKLLTLETAAKKISSREAMLQTLASSTLYNAWPAQVTQDLKLMEQALQNKDFHLLGATAENNALSMHACMLAAKPAICYFTPQTLAIYQLVWKLRQEGIALYLTQDAGANLKVLYTEDKMLDALLSLL